MAPAANHRQKPSLSPLQEKTQHKTEERKMQKSLSNPATFSLKTGISREAGAPCRCFQCAGNTLWQDMGEAGAGGKRGVLSPRAAGAGAATSPLRERKGGSSDCWSPAGRAEPAALEAATSTCSAAEAPAQSCQGRNVSAQHQLVPPECPHRAQLGSPA